MTPRSLLIVLLVSTLTLAGCTKDDKTVKTVPHAEALKLVEERRDSLPGIIGENTKTENTNSIVTPCDGPDGGSEDVHVYSGVAHGQIYLPPERHVETLARLKAHLTANGYVVTEEKTHTAERGGGLLRVRSTADEVEIRLLSTDPPTAFAVLVATPCYYSPETM